MTQWKDRMIPIAVLVAVAVLGALVYLQQGVETTDVPNDHPEMGPTPSPTPEPEVTTVETLPTDGWVTPRDLKERYGFDCENDGEIMYGIIHGRVILTDERPGYERREHVIHLAPRDMGDIPEGSYNGEYRTYNDILYRYAKVSNTSLFDDNYFFHVGSLWDTGIFHTEGERVDNPQDRVYPWDDEVVEFEDFESWETVSRLGEDAYLAMKAYILEHDELKGDWVGYYEYASDGLETLKDYENMDHFITPFGSSVTEGVVDEAGGRYIIHHASIQYGYYSMSGSGPDPIVYSYSVYAGNVSGITVIGKIVLEGETVYESAEDMDRIRTEGRYGE